MRHFDNLLEFVGHLATLEAAVHHEHHHVLEAAAKLLERDAREQLGHYQDAHGPFPAWAALADSTEADKARLGAPADAPLERFGDLEKSFQHEVHGNEALIGSTSPVMPFHEFGTRKMPPRPVLGPALFKHTDEIVRMVGRATVLALIEGEFASHRLAQELKE